MPSNPKNTRKCSVCREHADKSELVRLVKTENGIELDLTGKHDGRGVYVHRNAECIAKAEKKRTLNAAFRTAVPDSVYDELKKVLEDER